MIQNVSFRRKVLYLAVIALLLFPLYMIGRPATGDPGQSAQARPGGTLAQLRSVYDLSQAELGEIDPASESMRLATLGMRGVAANILWTKANEYKKTENWEALVATVNQMAKLQPNFVTVWEFQSHNLSYNISVEQDDYRFRYLWVKKGIDFLIQGTRYNRREPRLFWTVGWYTGQKFGRADEHKQFRRLFRMDEEFHESLSEYVDVDGEGQGPNGRPDNWLVSRLWFLRGYDLVDKQGASLRGKSPHIFFADGPKARMNFADAIESEGYLDEQAEIAWRKASDEWRQFGSRLVPTSWGENIRLNDEESLRAEFARLQKELDEVAPGVREAIRQEKLAALTPEVRAALEIPLSKIEDEQTYTRHMEGEARTAVREREVADRAPRELRVKAFQMAKRAEEAVVSADRVSRYRENVNFNYWKTRGEVEQQPDAVSARRHVYQAKQLQTDGELEQALKEYEAAWTLWASILEKNPSLMEQLMADDLLEDVQAYVKLLGQLELRLSPDFKLLKLLELYGELPEYLRPAGSNAATASESPASSSNAEPVSPAPAANAVEPAAPASKPDTTEKPADSAATSAPAEVTPQPAAAAPTAADTPPPAPEASPAPAEAPRPNHAPPAEGNSP